MNDYKEQLIAFRANPTLMHRHSLNTFVSAHGGDIDIPNATNPFVFSQENTALHTSAFMMAAEALTRKMYPVLATTEEELYYHMTEEDFANRFAIPGKASEVVINFSLDELKAKGKRDPKTGSTRIVIPWSTVLRAGQIDLGFFYDIEIIILRNGGVRVTWEGDLANGVIPLETNTVEFDTYSEARAKGTLLRLFIPAHQYTLNTQYLNMSSSGAKKGMYPISGKYYTAVVWNLNPITKEWERITTTHSAQTFDPDRLTALLKVTDGILSVDIPDIYSGNPKLGDQIRIDVYSTLGKVDVNLGDLSSDMFSATWRDIDKTNAEYSAVLSTLNTVYIGSLTNLSGGRDSLTASELKERVVYRSNRKSIPITPRDQVIKLVDRGMTIMPIVDNVTDRAYLTTKSISGPKSTASVAPAGVMTTLTTLDSSELGHLDTVVVNDTRITIKPETLFTYQSGVVKLVSDAERNNLDSLEGAELITAVNNGSYVYTPFHYVMDSSGNDFTFRAYHLDQPTLQGRQFLADNDSVPLVLIPKGYSFVKKDDGYSIEVALDKDAGLNRFKPHELFVQLAFIPHQGKSRVYMTGTYIGVSGENKDPVFRFELNTDYIIDRNDAILFEGFQSSSNDLLKYSCRLTETFEVFVGVYNHVERFVTYDPEYTDMDKLICKDLLASDEHLVMSHNTVTLRFGDALPDLYSASLSVASDVKYRTYEYDEYWYHEVDVLEMDPETGYAKIYIIDGKATTKVIHHAGDAVLKDGVHQIRHAAGSTMYDQEGNPIPINSSAVIQQCEVFLIDGKYRYTDEPNMVAYRDGIANEIVGFIANDIVPIRKELIGRTELFLSPQRTMGLMPVTVGEQVMNLDARQTFKVDIWVDGDTYTNTLLRKSIEATVKSIVVSNINGRSIVISEIQSKIQNALGGDVIGVAVHGLGRDGSVFTLDINDEDTSLELATELIIRSDGKVVIADKLACNFIKAK